MVSATILASPDPQVWQLLGLARILAAVARSAERATNVSAKVAEVPGKAESACLDVCLL